MKQRTVKMKHAVDVGKTEEMQEAERESKGGMDRAENGKRKG